MTLLFRGSGQGLSPAPASSFVWPTLALACLSALPASALGQPDQLWSHRFGTDYEDHAYALATDSAGGVFLAGHTAGNLGGFNAGLADIFIARHDPAGDQTWITQFGTNFNERTFAAAPDASGGLFIAGYTDGSLGGLNAGKSDAFLARYDSAGNQLWVRQFGTTEADRAEALTPDGQGGVFITGNTYGDLGAENSGQSDIFIARYDAGGVKAWITQFGADSFDLAYAITPDGQGGLFIAGETMSDLGGQNTGAFDAFLARCDDAGHPVWIRQFGSEDNEAANALTPDSAGGVFVAGITDGNLAHPVIGGADIFLARYDSEGHTYWLTQHGTDADDTPWALLDGGPDGVLIAGNTYGDFGAPSLGWNDIFVARCDAAGDPEWVTQFGTPHSDSAYGLVPAAGGFFVGGDMWSQTADHDLGTYEAFVARFGLPCPADCDFSGALDIFDFLCFVNHFNVWDERADCDGDGEFEIFDFLCYLNSFNTGC
jgi:hypothetical protein